MIQRIFQMLIISIVTCYTCMTFIDSYQHLAIYKKRYRTVEVLKTSIKGNIIELTSEKNITFKYNNKIFNLNVSLSDYYKAKHNKYIKLYFSNYSISNNKLNINIKCIYLNILLLIILFILIISIYNENKFTNIN